LRKAAEAAATATAATGHTIIVTAISDIVATATATVTSSIALAATVGIQLNAGCQVNIEIAHLGSGITLITYVTLNTVMVLPVNSRCVTAGTAKAAVSATCADASSCAATAVATIATITWPYTTTFVPTSITTAIAIAAVGCVTALGYHFAVALKEERASLRQVDACTST
jgi:hypothetical protein